MSFLLRQVAHCDVCGHEWLTAKVPSHCAKCKSRKWNQQVVEMANGSSITFTGGKGGKLRPAPDLPCIAELENRLRPRHAKTCKCLMCKPPKKG